MIHRLIKLQIEESLQNNSATALLGPRQAGKTTIAYNYVSSKYNAIYLDLQLPEDQAKLSDPVYFFSNNSDKLIILDEIQKSPELFSVLRGVIDKNRREGRKHGQFLILGSASMDLLRQSSESLAGRIGYLEMSGLNLLEIKDKSQESKDLQDKLWLRGGFPDSYLCETNIQAMIWLENIIRTYVERDIIQMGFNIPSSRMRRLWTMLAHLNGETVNYSNLANSLGVEDGKTVSKYIDILVDLFLVRRLEPYYTNVKKRLVKSPRFYIRDSGILHRLLGIMDSSTLISNPISGKSFEGFVIENILSVLPNTSQSYFYRTAAGAEIDLVLKISDTEVWAVEIKKSTAPKVKPGFYRACEDIKATKRFVVYSGQDEFKIKHDITVISLEKIMSLLTEL
jgi:predicted AAA+ superfamily ATPase